MTLVLKKRLENFCKLIITTQSLRDKRAKDLTDFIKWGIENIPLEIRNEVGTFYKPIKDKSCCIELTPYDYYWWLNYTTNHPLEVIEPISKIQNALLDKIMIISDKATRELKEELEDTIKEMQNIVV